MSYITTDVGEIRRSVPWPAKDMSLVPVGGLMVLTVELLRSLISTCWFVGVNTAKRFLATKTADFPEPLFVSVGSTAPLGSFGKLTSSYDPPSADDVTRTEFSTGLCEMVLGGTHAFPNFFKLTKDGDSSFVARND
jgi:hypothetical protein